MPRLAKAALQPQRRELLTKSHQHLALLIPWNAVKNFNENQTANRTALCTNQSETADHTLCEEVLT